MRTLTTKTYKFVDPPFYGLPAMNPKYTAIIHCPDKGILIAASLPSEFSFGFASQYDSSFRDMLPGAGVLDEFEPAYRAFGGSFNTKALTSRVWQGANHVEFTLDLNFVYEEDMERDVRAPIAKLLSLVVAEEKEAGDLLGAPGPHLDAKKMIRRVAADAKEVAPVVANKAKSAVATGVNAAESVHQNPIGTTYDKLKSAGKDLVGAASSTLSDPTIAADKSIEAWERASDTTKSGFRYLSSVIDEATVNKTSLYLGMHWYWPSIVVTNVDLSTRTLPTRTGYMKTVAAAVTFSTFTVPTSRDISRMYSPLDSGE